MTFSVQCSNCKTNSGQLPPRTQVAVCQECGHGCRLRVLSASIAGYRIQIAPLEPPHDDPKKQALNSGALMAGWR